MDWGSISSWFATLDYGNVADWVSAAGTIFAAVVALYLGLHKPKAKLLFHTNKSGSDTLVAISNIGKATATIANGDVNNNAYDGVENLMPRYTNKLLVLHPGNVAGFYVAKISALTNTDPTKITLQYSDCNVSTGYMVEIVWKRGSWKIKSVTTKDVKELLKRTGTAATPGKVADIIDLFRR